MDKIIRVGIGVILLNAEGQFLMGQRKNTHGEGAWALPGGAMEFGEDFTSCARREAKEETGLDIANVEILCAANHFFPEHNKHFVALYAIATIVGAAQPRIMEPEKCAGWHFFDSWQNLPQNLFVDYHNEVKADLIEAYKATHLKIDQTKNQRHSARSVA